MSAAPLAAKLAAEFAAEPKGTPAMRVFVTGASGWIGSATVDELLAAGHEVTGLARSDASAAAERAAVQTIGDALVGTGRPFLLASGVAGLTQGGALCTEADASPFHGPDAPRGGSENLALEFVDRGVGTVSLRFSPTTHGAGDHGFIAAIAAVAREKGVSGYPGDGANRWAAVHVSDAARLVALGLAKAPAGTRLHAVAEEGVPTRAIAEAIGRAFGLPVASIAPDDVLGHFGWIGNFFAMDLAASSAVTRELLGWTPVGPTLIEDIDNGGYSAGVSS